MKDLEHFSYDNKQFGSASEELTYLRKVVAEREGALSERGEKFEREAIIKQEIQDYSQHQANRVLHESFKMPDSERREIVLELTPESHDNKIEELLGMLGTKGIKNTLEVVRALGNPHIDDDFHRFLVEYIKKGFDVPGLKEKTPLDRTLRHTLYEVALPETKKEDKEKQLKEMLSSMEQFYAGMLSTADLSNIAGESHNHFTIELAVSEGSEEFIFYVSIPDEKTALFEKQILSIFPNAKIAEKKDDYNIFNNDGVAVASIAKQSKNPIYPIKTYDQFDYDPLNVLLNTLSKVKKDGEGASVQLVLNPMGDYYVKLYKEALDDIQKGTKVKKAIDIRHTLWGEFTKMAAEAGKDFAKEAFAGATDSKDEDKEKDKKKDKEEVVDQIASDQIKTKIATPIIESNIRIVASAENTSRAEAILSDIESAFNQFQNSLGNSLEFKRQKKGDLTDTLHHFTYRDFVSENAMPTSLRELATLVHFPVSQNSSPQLKQSKAATAPAPLGLSKDGLFLGKNRHRNMETDIFITAEDRLRHFYTIGQTGTGKSTMLKNMIIQDIHNGEGVCFIDPHGNDVQDILAHIPPERYDDVVYFDPSNTERPMALNMLEYNRDFPEQKTFVVNELFSIFQKLYGANPESMGPMFEQYFRNAAMLVIEDPDSGSTLLDVSRVLSVKSFRDMKVSRCKNPIVVQFWKEIAEKAGGEGSLQNIVPYIVSKFDVFLANDIMRPIIAQEKSSFNFREIMDNKKILLVNLAKGRLGDINASLIGLILVGKILMAALSRVDSFGKHMNPFYLYIDEFQNITTPSISTILSEARKYKLSLNIAHQFISQLDEKIRDAVFGNVGSMAVFRVGADDAEFLQKQFEPIFTMNDIMNNDNMNCYLRMLSGGKPVRPFNIEFTWPPKGNEEIVDKLKELSALKFGRQRDDVEKEVQLKYKKEPVPIPAAPRPNPFTV
ncbi:MAG: TraM recognition domain-containing protein [bacterium]